MVTVVEPGQPTLNLRRPVISPWNFGSSSSSSGSSGGGRTFWVDVNGNDNNNGSSVSPFATFAKGLATAQAGDLVNVNPGHYTENYNTALNSGTAARPIVLSCAPGALGKVYLTRPQADVLANSDKSVINIGTNLVAVSYLTINGINLVGPLHTPWQPSPPGEVSCGIIGGTPGTGIRITNCCSWWNSHCGFKGDSNITLEACLSFSNGVSDLDHGVYLVGDNEVIHGNMVWNNFGYGLHLFHSGFSPSNFSMTRNVVWGHNTTGKGGILLAGSNGTCANNTAPDNFNGMICFTNQCHDNNLNHNIWGPSTDSWDMQTSAPADPPANILCNFNNYRSVFSYNPHFFDANTPSGPGVNDVLGDPLFVNSAAFDYRLQGGSPCPTFGAYA